MHTRTTFRLSNDICDSLQYIYKHILKNRSSINEKYRYLVYCDRRSKEIVWTAIAPLVDTGVKEYSTMSKNKDAKIYVIIIFDDISYLGNISDPDFNDFSMDGTFGNHKTLIDAFERDKLSIEKEGFANAHPSIYY